MYESVDANFDDMEMHVECRALDLHDFFNVGWQTVGVRKEHKIVMKSDTAYKTHNKDFAYFIMKTIWIAKVAKLLSPSIYI